MSDLSNRLINWYRQNRRELPWRETSDPYKIWLSEIIMQQTRVSQGLNFYLQFVSEFPDIFALAQASQQKIYKMWQGLGYYSRADNLMTAAKTIVNQYNGIFPADYEKIIKIKGIGTYSAAAILSISFQKPFPVVDGNVFRFLSRCFGIDIPINTSKSKKVFVQLSAGLMANHSPGEFNQAIMEFGALFCTSKNPDCPACIFKKDCFAWKNDMVRKFPVRNPKPEVKKRYIYYFVLEFEKKKVHFFQLKKRSEKGIWKNLYDFPQVETENSAEIEWVLEDFVKHTSYSNFYIKNISDLYVHQLTHQQINATFIRFVVDKIPAKCGIKSLLLVSEKDIVNYPVPRLIERYLTDQKII